MSDLLVVLFLAAAFTVAGVYVWVCDRLTLR